MSNKIHMLLGKYPYKNKWIGTPVCRQKGCTFCATKWEDVTCRRCLKILASWDK